MTTNLERASVVSRHVELESVVLTHIEMKAGPDPLEIPTDLRLVQQFRCRFELPTTRADHVFVYVDFRFDATSTGDVQEERPLLGLSATFLAIYRLTDARSYPSDSLKHFADLNGAYNVWPYWRELVQSVAARAGLASIVVPVFKPPIRRIDEQKEIPFAEKTESRERVDP